MHINAGEVLTMKVLLRRKKVAHNYGKKTIPQINYEHFDVTGVLRRSYEGMTIFLSIYLPLRGGCDARLNTVILFF